MENEEMDVVEDIENISEEADLYPEEVIETLDEDNANEVVSKSEYEKLKEIAENQRIRAEKAEKKLKGEPKAESKPKSDNLTTHDLYALMEAKVPQDDIEEVTDFARLKGITVGEALKSNTVKVILKEKEELRNSASATNTAPGRRGTSKVSDDTLLDNAKKGIMPDSDEDFGRLVEARLGAYKK